MRSPNDKPGLADTYNLIAEDWTKDHALDVWWNAATQRFISLFKARDLILDVGCGPGWKAEFMVKQGLKVCGIDISSKFIEIAQQKVPGAEFMVMDMADISKLMQKFDGIFSQASLLHVRKAQVLDICRNWDEKLKPGGYMYIAVKEKRQNGPEEETLLENDYNYEYQRFFSYYSQAEIEALFKKINYTIIYSVVTQANHANWAQVIGQK